MSEPQVETRVERHQRLSRVFERLSDPELVEWIGRPGQGSGWGDSRTAELNGLPVFVKRIAVTAREMESPYSTRNLYGMPLFYNYGVGSMGFGAFRELAGHIITTAWVEEGFCERFPLMYHQRIVPREEAPEPVRERQPGDYVQYWGGSDAVGEYVAARRAARHEMVVVLEHFPQTLAPWLLDHPEQIDKVLSQLFEIVRAMRERGVVHFDAHFQNVLTDGQTCFLTDFGLLLAEAFELDSAERDFLARHLDYDYGEILYNLGMQVGRHVGRLPADEQQRLKDAMGLEGELLNGRSFNELMERYEEVAQVTPLPVPLLGAMRRFRGPMLYMGEFLETLRADRKKDTPFDGPRLRRLLLDAAVPV